MFQIGPYIIDSKVILAPMAGVTDQPFRQLCRRLGAGLVVSEMVTSDTRLWNSRKSSFRLNHKGEEEPRSVQIAGGDPQMMAEAARMNVVNGAQIIDINMGCPAKKVCNKAAGSALLKDEPLVLSILQSVVAAVDVPVTLKIRTGWSIDQKNAETIARMAEDSGIKALAIHGRTRTCGYKGEAEYDTIAKVRKLIEIPLFANGDISTPEKAKEVLDYTGADAVMIGRTAQGNPWIFKEIDHYLRYNERLEKPAEKEVQLTLLSHVAALHQFYGEYLGVRIARKHVGWYLHHQSKSVSFRAHFNQLESAVEQVAAIEQYFQRSRLSFAAA
ncbi:tRNA dihydrouridine synthase DusB [Neptunomonas antarctica]|uniref:tRNA-dihydrouridine synthase B n=1 Tax=Neptunomonas antarctica TaxID=619304 RepID=A0A1N7MYP8_9GAMM|nr:tRNA dihydrouridine synthase DusB [Neptunomonas antarctica]SIS91243.1 tRNA-U20-dihydrouridine synthase [Neptunomonas antarctica]